MKKIVIIEILLAGRKEQRKKTETKYLDTLVYQDNHPFRRTISYKSGHIGREEDPEHKSRAWNFALTDMKE